MDEHKAKGVPRMDEGRKRVLGIMAAILTAIHMPRARDLFGTPSGTPASDKLISASVQWARKIMDKIDHSLSDKPWRDAIRLEDCAT
jgi:hypothetical protein